MTERLKILILEDNRADVYLLQEALHKANIDFTSVVFEDGESAFNYIDEEPEPGASRVPDVAILDLNVPKRNGSEVLACIRRNRKWQHIAVMVLSSSPKHLMRDSAQADCYVTKPTELAEFLHIGEQLRDCVETVRMTRPLPRILAPDEPHRVLPDCEPQRSVLDAESG
jgi:chemotaxis family two-component system response regulator Rcp1